MKIPTTLGLSFLTILITLAILLYIYTQQVYSTPLLGVTVQDLKTANITSSSVSVLWQTAQPVVGEVEWGENKALTNFQGDDRDIDGPTPRITHFVTINHLAPSHTYDFKIQNNQLFSSNQILHFTTAKVSSTINLAAAQIKNTPLLGTVLDNKLQPVKESLLILTISNTSALATFTTTAGNFLLPTANLETLSLTDSDPLNTQVKANLEVLSGTKRSEIRLNVPLSSSLPPIILGQDSDFTRL